MLSSRSPRKVLLTAYRLARRTLPDHTCRCSRHDFTLAQLFACLVLREFYGLSYRRVEQLLRRQPALADGHRHEPAPLTTTRCGERWASFYGPARVNRMLDLQAELFLKARLLRLSIGPLGDGQHLFRAASSFDSLRPTMPTDAQRTNGRALASRSSKHR